MDRSQHQRRRPKGRLTATQRRERDVQRTLLSTILKIFCTLIEWLVEQKIKGAFIALEKRFACARGSIGVSGLVRPVSVVQ